MGISRKIAAALLGSALAALGTSRSTYADDAQEQMRALTRVVAENYRANYKQQRDYTYIEREVQKKLDGKGQVKSTESKTYEVLEIAGDGAYRLNTEAIAPSALSARLTEVFARRMQRVLFVKAADGLEFQVVANAIDEKITEMPE